MCPECFHLLRDAVIPRVIVEAGANGSANVALYELVTALQQRGVDPAQLGVSVDPAWFDPSAQARAALAAFEPALKRLHDLMSADPRLRSQLRFTPVPPRGFAEAYGSYGASPQGPGLVPGQPPPQGYPQGLPFAPGAPLGAAPFAPEPTNAPYAPYPQDLGPAYHGVPAPSGPMGAPFGPGYGFPPPGAAMAPPQPPQPAPESNVDPSRTQTQDPFDMLGIAAPPSAPKITLGSIFGTSGTSGAPGAEIDPGLVEERPRKAPKPEVPVEKLEPRAAADVEVERARSAARPLDAEEIAAAAIPFDSDPSSATNSALSVQADRTKNGAGA
jgi:hypothetical protein